MKKSLRPRGKPENVELAKLRGGLGTNVGEIEFKIDRTAATVIRMSTASPAVGGSQVAERSLTMGRIYTAQRQCANRECVEQWTGKNGRGRSDG